MSLDLSFNFPYLCFSPALSSPLFSWLQCTVLSLHFIFKDYISYFLKFYSNLNFLVFFWDTYSSPCFLFFKIRHLVYILYFILSKSDVFEGLILLLLFVTFLIILMIYCFLCVFKFCSCVIAWCAFIMGIPWGWVEDVWVCMICVYFSPSFSSATILRPFAVSVLVCDLVT